MAENVTIQQISKVLILNPHNHHKKNTKITHTVCPLNATHLWTRPEWPFRIYYFDGPGKPSAAEASAVLAKLQCSSSYSPSAEVTSEFYANITNNDWI